MRDPDHHNLRSRNRNATQPVIIDRTADGAEDSAQTSENFTENDNESEEWARLRCSSVQTEVIAERNRRNRQRSAGYPGLAFGASIFSSGTMMKFSVIHNELHNIMNVQLKRVNINIKFLLYLAYKVSK